MFYSFQCSPSLITQQCCTRYPGIKAENQIHCTETCQGKWGPWRSRLQTPPSVLIHLSHEKSVLLPASLKYKLGRRNELHLRGSRNHVQPTWAFQDPAKNLFLKEKMSVRLINLYPDLLQKKRRQKLPLSEMRDGITTDFTDIKRMIM